MMDAFLEMMQGLAEFGDLVQDIQKKNMPVGVTGVSDSVRAHLIDCVMKSQQKPALVVTADESTARQLYADLKFFLGDIVHLYPRTDLLFYDVEAKGQDVTGQRLSVLWHMLKDESFCVVCTAEAMLQATLPKAACQKLALQLTVGEEMELSEIAVRLTVLGYRREEMVEGPGQFSMRGGILDVFPFAGSGGLPVRVEFFDTEIDSVRSFDPESQRTVDKLECIEILPARELLLSDTERSLLTEKLRKLQKGIKPSVETAEKLAKTLSRDIERLEEGLLFASLDKYIPYLYDTVPTILDYLPKDALIFWDEAARIREKTEQLTRQQSEDVLDMAERGMIPRGDVSYTLPYPEAVRRIEKRLIGLSGVARTSPDYRPVRMHSFTCKSLGGFQSKLEFLCDTLRFYQKEKYRTVLLAGSPLRAQRLAAQLEEEQIRCSYQETLQKLPSPGGIVVSSGSIGRSFDYPLIRTAVIGDREIFGGEKKKKRRSARPQGEKISSFTDLNPGDYVVHQNHGIGVYTGIEQLYVDGVRKDYLKIQYRGSDVLYVPTDQMDMVFRHTAAEGVRIRVNKLGGAEWSNTKQRVKTAAKDMAKELIALYAKRSQIPGIAFFKDSEWQRDFEAAFPYEETDDQLRSIEEVKADMEKPHPMDRLLCGDVGYGKTEVAMRAAFKAVMSGYQVAYLVPTTILAAQHFHNFRQRMMHYPITVGMLSRFVTGTAQKEVIRGLETGETDIVIGTHKLLGKNIHFHKLGLLVIDEEQRFGVAHKEKLKEIRKEVDVLTLSATPIPRTLHMSLSGIRDMSLLTQPPSERYPVATYVLEYEEDVIREAISREIGRGGQVYYLYNRVEGIYKAANRIAEMAPEARVAVAHGQMRERELEEIMMSVSEGEIDVLVCTTIIETGLDIANVNTIIIENADRLGLAQLYQLRGRVGRSNRLAYAYLTFRKDKILTPEAEKRLLAIKEFTEFGSGFKIAMQDLEIRGTGNLIGAQQHGHMEAVGYEMYCRLLEQAVREQQGEEAVPQTETTIDLPVSAYIPNGYITNHSQRISAYKRIAAIKNQDELYDAYDEIEDRYGTVPQSVYQLMEVARLKAAAQKAAVTEILGSGDKVIYRFDEKHLPDFTRLLQLVQARPKEFFLPGSKEPKLHQKLKKPETGGEKAYFAAIFEVLKTLCTTEESEKI